MAVKIPYILEPGTTKGYIAKAEYIKGSFIVVESIEDALNLPTTVLEDNNPVFIKSLSQVYQYDSLNKQFIPSPGAITEAPKDGNVYGRKNGEWYIIGDVGSLINYYTKEETNNIFVQKENLNEYIQLINGGKADTIFY